ncbi:hypothetical protein [Aneurinibacillus aneurinilyticus]|jgi:hypothetical protein|uniref:hypothetical protein n=1 Tax=Aneurinibacillus aneurinilyticus TaxID=1391 RepID=UPI0023F9A34D|nr:hypothetical protein [Aneurinibacillus aneurinilyticus]MCI1693288.1 hypothetical protein [Aneurinibacillus aneurinilyticus]
MDGEQNKKVIIENFEYKRQYKEIVTSNGEKYIDANNYTYWTTNITVEVLKPEQIVFLNNDIERFAKEVQDKFTGLFDARKNKITEGQIKFSYDATLSIMGEVRNPDKITIIPAKAGFGKSSYIYSFLSNLCSHIKNNDSSSFSGQGVIIVTDKIESLRQLEKDIFKDMDYYHVGDYKTRYTYILEAWNKNSFRDGICKNEAIEEYEYGMCSGNECPFYNNCKMSYQKKQQVYSPILLITNARFRQFQERIEEYKTWIDKNGNYQERNIVIIDEKPTIIDDYRVDTDLFSTLKKTVEEVKVDVSENKNKEFLLKELLMVEDEVLNLRSEMGQYRNCIYCGTKEKLFSDEFNEKWGALIGYKHINSLNALERMFTQGALWCNANAPYFKTLGIKQFNYSGFKTYIFDATAELDPDYDDERFQFLSIDDYKNYENITFHIFRDKKMNMSRSALDLKKHYWKNKAVAEWINNNFRDKTYVVSYKKNVKVISKYLKHKGTRIFLDSDEEKPVIPHFGDTKGSNEFKDAKYMVQIGWNKAPSDEYLSQCLSRNTNFEKLFEPREDKAEQTAKILENKNGYFKKYDDANIYMWRKMAVEFEQEVFRTCVRDFSADNKVDIYIFMPDEKVIGLIYQRFKKCKIKTSYEVPVEFREEKILGRQNADGKDNKIQTFIKWIRDEWDGSKISIKDIKAKFELSDKYWEKINSNTAVKNIKMNRNIKLKREGKGKNQVNYWYALSND